MDELKESIQTQERQLASDREELEQIDKLLSLGQGSQSGFTNRYPSGGTLTAKIKFVLEELKLATAKEIFQKLQQYDKSMNLSSVLTSTSKMASEGQLTVNKEDKRNVYSLA